jgi:tetratricopeptide (TPR) repeat protein
MRPPVKSLASTFDEMTMAPVQHRWVLSRLILTSLLASISLPNLIVGANADQPPTPVPIVQLANNENPGAPESADLAPAIAQLKAKNYAAAEALLLKLQAPDRLDAYQYLFFAQLAQAGSQPSRYADLWIEAIDRSYQGFAVSSPEPPTWLAESVAKPLEILRSPASPQLLAEIQARIQAQPDAIAPRLSLLFLLSRPAEGIEPAIGQIIHTQVQELLQRHGKNSNVLTFLITSIDFEQWDIDRQPILEQTLALDLGQTDVRQALAMMLAARSNIAEAQTLLSSGPDANSPSLQQIQAQIKETIGDLEGALNIYRQVLAQSPDQADHNTLMRLSRELGQFDQGLALYQSLRQSQPAIAAQGYAAAADQLMEQDGEANTKRSFTLRQQAQRLDPTNSSLTQQLISLYRSENRPAEALKLAEALHKLAPDNIDGTFQLIELLSANQFDRALSLGQQLIQTDPNNAIGVLSNLLNGIMSVPEEDLSPAQVEAHYQKTNAAGLALTDRFAQQYPTQAETLYTILAGRFGGADAIPQGLALYRKLQQINPKNTEYIVQTAWSYQSNDQLDKAIATLQTALTQTPGNGELSLALARMFIEKRRIPESIALFKPEIRKNPELALNAASQLQSGDHHPAAIELLELALKGQPNNAELLSDYGLSLEKTGQPDRAITTYRQALALTPKRGRTSSAAAGRLVYLMVRQGKFDPAVTEAIAIASAAPKPIYLGDTTNPFTFLTDNEEDHPEDSNQPAAHLDRRIYQAIISQLTPKGPSLLLAAAHEGLGQSLLDDTSPAEAIRQYETAEAIYQATNSLDRAFALTRQITQLKRQW